jgi:hypothetical protein
MKNILFIGAVLISLFLLSCSKDAKVKVIVVKDCTGTYLKKEGKDYHVCNIEKVAKYADGTVVMASFTLLKECNGSGANQIVCMMLHENEGWIEVQDIE